jgi:hypothetical protein
VLFGVDACVVRVGAGDLDPVAGWAAGGAVLAGQVQDSAAAGVDGDGVERSRTRGRSSAAFCSAGTSSSTRRPRSSPPLLSRSRSNDQRSARPFATDVAIVESPPAAPASVPEFNVYIWEIGKATRRQVHVINPHVDFPRRHWLGALTAARHPGIRCVVVMYPRAESEDGVTATVTDLQVNALAPDGLPRAKVCERSRVDYFRHPRADARGLRPNAVMLAESEKRHRETPGTDSADGGQPVRYRTHGSSPNCWSSET